MVVADRVTRRRAVASGWRDRAAQRTEALIAAALPALMRRALRRSLAGVWGASPPPLPGGAVLVANHHSWWDGYLTWFLVTRWRRPAAMMVDAVTLERFPFFRRLGALSPSELRVAARRVAAGAHLVVFPEGRISPVGSPGPFRPGAAALSRWARAPVVPVAIRVALRGRRLPEAYLRVGEPLPVGTGPEAQREAVAGLLARIEEAVADSDDPEAPLPGYDLWLPGGVSGHERAARWSWAWSRRS